MTRELFLLRHGKSDRFTDLDDFQRPLTNRGKRGAQRVGVWLAQHDLAPDLVVASPAERALLTAQKCCKAMGMAASRVQTDERIYSAGVRNLLDVLGDCPAAAGRVMLVGHNPGLELLLQHLSDAPVEMPEDRKLMPTAALARLAMPDDWSALQQGQAKLLRLIRAADLPKAFAFPSPHGAELRDRPAYYYTQSSVVPYRVNAGQLEILIIQSSQKKHWVVPKGIADPGMTLQESAAQEAWEEAGVEGDVADEALGAYSYAKWGATCTVTVFPMAVTRQLSEEAWEEDHRGREWVTPEEARKRLKQLDIGPMIMALEKRLKQV